MLSAPHGAPRAHNRHQPGPPDSASSGVFTATGIGKRGHGTFTARRRSSPTFTRPSAAKTKPAPPRRAASATHAGRACTAPTTSPSTRSTQDTTRLVSGAQGGTPGRGTKFPSEKAELRRAASPKWVEGLQKQPPAPDSPRPPGQPVLRRGRRWGALTCWARISSRMRPIHRNVEACAVGLRPAGVPWHPRGSFSGDL